MHPILLQLGSLEIRSYGVIVTVSVLVAYFIARREATARRLDPRLVESFAISAIFAGIVGARLYYVVFFDPGMFVREPFMVLAIWRGGLAIHGALVGGVMAGFLFSQKHGLSFWTLADTLAPALLLGQAIGRLACLLNGDAYGIPTDVPWAITFTDPNALAPLGIPLHPTQLYEMGLDLILLALIWPLRKRRLVAGQLFLCYAAGYAVIRLVVEGFRADQLQFAGGVSVAQSLSVLVLIASIVGFTILEGRKKLSPIGAESDSRRSAQ